MDAAEQMLDAANYQDFSEDEVPALGHDSSGDEQMSDGGEQEAFDNATQDDSDSNSDADYPAPVPMPRRMRIFGDRRIGLPEFLRMIAPLHVPPMAPGDSSNEQLIQQLKNSSNMKCKRVIKAFQVVSRDLFVPEDQLQDAYYDRPLRLDSDFNISAPHMHACMTEALNIQPGDKVLDIGSGCGVTTAICAFLAGKEGQVVGLEVRDVALALSAKGLQAVMAKPEFTSAACVPTFEKCNAFIAPHHEGLYDKVHVGGSCPEDKVSTLLRMLKPDNGTLVVPAGQNLLRFTRQDGQTKREVLAAVRFGELELPTESAIVLGHLQRHRFKVSSPPKEESPYQHEMSAVLFGESSVPELLVEEKDDEHFSICGCSGMLHSPLTRTSPSTPMSRNGRTYSTSSSGSGSSFPLPTSVEGVLEGLGLPDCTIVGADFKIPAHSAVLKARCMLLRARFASGMADSNDDVISMPSHFDAHTIQICLDHLYHDKTALDDSNAVRVLHAASYLGVPHLVTLCQGFIIKHLQTQPLREALDSAAELHMFASENGLDALRSFCASFQAMHIALARNSPGYSRLGPRELDEIIRALATEHDVILTQLRQLSGDMQTSAEEAAAHASQIHAL